LQTDPGSNAENPMTPLNTFQKLSAEKQERITRVALEEFSQKGYQGTSINVLVQRLGIAKGSIFQYFGDKKGLFYFVFSQAMHRVKDYLRTVRDQTVDEDVFSRLEKTMRAGVRFINKHPGLYALYLKMMFESSIPMRNDILRSLRENSLDYLKSLLEEGRERGELRPDLDLDQISFILDAVMDRFLQAQTIPHLDAGLGLYRVDEVLADEWIANVVDFIRKGIAA
jgi:TetR/AcrR family transcriptional regulator